MEQKKHNQKYRVGIVTLSDKGFKGEREDLSGPKIKSLLPTEKYEVVSYCILPDDQKAIEKELCGLCNDIRRNHIAWNAVLCTDNRRNWFF